MSCKKSSSSDPLRKNNLNKAQKKIHKKKVGLSGRANSSNFFLFLELQKVILVARPFPLTTPPPRLVVGPLVEELIFVASLPLHCHLLSSVE